MEIVCATYAAFGSGLGMDDVPSSVSSCPGDGLNSG
eukprot:CAMPEP_0119213536 /NCGR_PEP_ID=MMETSP1327-20130426/7177_1 /TAXON_ID=38833 /ORGANISM="Micromonas pusilla, Strain RCC2306" /LENGTH=35 /DNA_ID= /DNA_START= /DNA_END= /DNA_ORIENTATION=